MPRTVLCSTCKRDLATPDLPFYSLRRDILRSMWIPSESEASQIEQEIVDYERRNLLSPIRKLPIEILGEIFAASCSGYGLLITTIPEPEGKISAHTLTLSHVCSQWRNFVISTPSLWSRMSVDFVHAGKERARSLVELYLTLSRPAPLTCRIEASESPSGTYESMDVFSAPDGYVSEDDHLSIFELFLPEHDRWRNVSLNLTFFDTFHIVFAAYSFPLLETLRIDWGLEAPPYDDHTDGLIYRIMNDSPLLRNLVLSNFHDQFARVVPFNHHQVTSLRIVGVFFENELGVVDIFRLFVQLEHLEINLGEDLLQASQIDGDVPHPQCHSSTLKTLVIKARSMFSSNRVISSLEAGR
ncbi:hypothetical protein K435DRAFT_847021 [Dendrothele bispora CBS 962.96]|uniref:Uncharacterized protein n=1 Tax=Dendrothele bispora (strain CBS 962.96) TaxID=1314807 RepID=A0A4S8MY70_DENBC|nr:hypothetical protein K435DRAFT_847021 [Dendrothele bispora CBS 962.96]